MVLPQDPLTKPVNKVDGAGLGSNSRPMHDISSWSYVWSVDDFASNLSMSMSTDGEKRITYRGVKESPVRNGSSLWDGLRVPGQVKDRQKRGTLVAEGRDSL